MSSLPGAFPSFSVDKTSKTSTGLVQSIAKLEFVSLGRSGADDGRLGRMDCDAKNRLSSCAFLKSVVAVVAPPVCGFFSSCKSGIAEVFTRPDHDFKRCQNCLEDVIEFDR